MNTPTELAQSIEDGVLKAVETIQQWTLEAIRATTSVIERLAPEVPNLPATRYVPSPQDTVTLGFDFAERLLAARRAFATEFAELLNPAPATSAGKAAGDTPTRKAAGDTSTRKAAGDTSARKGTGHTSAGKAAGETAA
jgi:hypothetical protein